MNHRSLTALACAVVLTTLSVTAQDKKTVPPTRDTSKTVQLTAPALPRTGPKPYKRGHYH